MSSKKRPNIVFLMSDQQRWDCLGRTNPMVKTPFLDKIADEGILFDQAVCQAPACVPSRYSMMTGLYPSQIGVFRNGQYIPDYNMISDTIPRALQKAGYQTAGFGKTHWSCKGCSTRGFDVRYIGQPRDSVLYEKDAVMMSDVNPDGLSRYYNETECYGQGEADVAGYVGCTSKLGENDHRDGWVFNQCLDFVDNDISSEDPLFLYLSFLKPHSGFNIPKDFEKWYDIEGIPIPSQPPEELVEPCHATGISHERGYADFWSRASKSQWQQMVLRYWANCSWIDSMFARVVDKLKAKGILDNCLIIYVSDHGEMLGERYYRFGKFCLYESSVRVPMILSGSYLDNSVRGRIDHRPAELIDIFPTLLSAAGIYFDQDSFCGRSLLEPNEKIAGFCEFHEKLDTKSYMWRKSNYKLILTMPDYCNRYGYRKQDIISGEMYHLIKDQQEWYNIYHENQYSNIREQLTNELLLHLNRYARCGKV